MNKITIQEFISKIEGYNQEIVIDDEGNTKIQGVPCGIIKEKGKPDIIRAFYNSRWYEWELVQ